MVDTRGYEQEKYRYRLLELILCKCPSIAEAYLPCVHSWIHKNLLTRKMVESMLLKAIPSAHVAFDRREPAALRLNIGRSAWLRLTPKAVA